MKTTAPRSVLAATDLTESSDPVLRAAAALAALADAQLHVIHALELPLMPYAESGREVATFAGRLEEAQESLDEQLARALPAHAKVTSAEVVVRSVHHAVLERGEEVEAELIVLGAHRPRPFADRFLGSTADRVIRVSPVPCLLVRRPLTLPLRRVMVPTDLSEESLVALEVALGWAQELGATNADGRVGAEVRVMHVIPRAYEMPDFAFDREVIQPELERVVARVLACAEPAGAVAIEERLTWGDVPEDEILREAEREKVDLLVIGTHGHGPVRRALLGSVASRVARAAPCPVLLVPPAGGVLEP